MEKQPLLARVIRSVVLNWPFWFVAGVFAVATFLYRDQFGTSRSSDPATWGQFGDFLGGVINPMVGLITIVLLLATLRSQRAQLDQEKLSNLKTDLYQSAERVFQEMKEVEQSLIKLTKGGSDPAILQSDVGRPQIAHWMGLAWELADYLDQIDVLSVDKFSTDYFRRRVIRLTKSLHGPLIPESLIQRLTPKHDFNFQNVI